MLPPALDAVKGRPGSRRAAAWPVAMRLDELWLRTRRALVEELSWQALWPDDESFAAVIEEERQAGTQLAGRLLPEILGQDRYSALMAGALFGPDGDGVSRQLPLTLRFGAILADPHSDLGAVFNLGISLLDCLLDGNGDREELQRQLTPESVRRGLGDAGEAQWPEPSRQCSAELEVVLALASAFLWNAASCNGGDELSANIELALRAEMSSVDPEADAETARQKSVLPFAILAQVKGASRREGDDLGEAFWLLDDVIDLVPDLRDGSVNALISKGMEPKEVAETLLRSDAIEAAAARAAAALGRVTANCEEAGDSALALRLRCYARDWIR